MQHKYNISFTCNWIHFLEYKQIPKLQCYNRIMLDRFFNIQCHNTKIKASEVPGIIVRIENTKKNTLNHFIFSLVVKYLQAKYLVFDINS